MGLAGVATAAVLGLVFLLGRESARREASQASPMPQGNWNSGPASIAPPVAAPPSPQPAAIPLPAPVTEGAASAGIGREGGTPPPAPRNDPMRPAVVAYFDAIARIQPDSLEGDPQAVAQQIVSGLGQGDASGMDRMIQQAQATRERMAALSPPAPCAAYHRHGLADLDASLALLHSLRKALQSPDASSQLLTLTDRANALQAQATALQEEGKALRQRYGLAP